MSVNNIFVYCIDTEDLQQRKQVICITLVVLLCLF